MFETESNEDNENLYLKIAIAEHLAEQKDYTIKEEIEAVNTELRKFGFSFFDLAECSPKSTKTKNACKQAVLYILDNKTVIKEIYETKQLPIKIIQKNTNLPRKLIERHRKYIIAMVEIFSGEYPFLADYVSYIRKRGN